MLAAVPSVGRVNIVANFSIFGGMMGWDVCQIA